MESLKAMKIEITLTSQFDGRDDIPLLILIKSSRRQSKEFNCFVLLASAKLKKKNDKIQDSNSL